MTSISKWKGLDIVNQIPNVASPKTKAYAERHYLPWLVAAWMHIEATTKYRWRSTSYWRMSPTHQHGEAIDIVPDIAKSSQHLYSVAHNSDPVLYKRTKLIRSLQEAAATFRKGPYLLGVFIEPDHLHIQVLRHDGDRRPMIIVKWKQPKPVYKDTYDRIKGGMISTSSAKRKAKTLRNKR